MRTLLSRVGLGDVELRRKHSVSIVGALPAALQLPARCANCGETASATQRERHKRDVLVPYCARCFASLTRLQTSALAGSIAGLGVGVTLLLTAPRLWPRLDLLSYLAICALPSLLPPLVSWLLTFTKQPEQSSGGRALWWHVAEELAATNEAWMDELCQINNLHARRGFAREPSAGLSLFAGSLLTFAAAPLLHGWFYPAILVLNLAAPEFELFVDGEPRGRVEPSSLESRDVGLRLHIAAGKHVLEARAVADNAGSVLTRDEVALDAGGSYLFAPGSDAYCFWLETDSYGRNARPQRVQHLAPSRHFWELPTRIDTWFGKNPATGSDRVSTGGEMVALRQDRCERVPPTAP